MFPRTITYDGNVSSVQPATGAAPSASFQAGMSHDPVMDRLVRALLPDADADEVLRGFYTDALHATLLKRLAGLRGEDRIRSTRGKPLPLQSWRLRRVYEYVEARPRNKIRLADMASAAGLSPMHFAAQFRMATGFRPHDYVVHWRIQRAKALLSGSDMAIIDVALSLGFQTQSHFTTVFGRVAGFTPRRWRSLRKHAGQAATQTGQGSRGAGPGAPGHDCFGQ